ncbi:MAG: translation elongation factor Ts [Andreesenia angusta]|nr:translation elongation factor Ts [Andreesenia angusta]
MKITAGMVKELREKTSAGMMDCKKALADANGDMEKAVVILREKGLSKVAKKADRVAAEGLVGLIVEDDKKAAMVEVNSETDFVSKNEDFQKFVSDVTKIASDKQLNDAESVLESELDGKKVQDVLNDLISKIGENMTVRRAASMSADNGVIEGYLHGTGNIGVIVKLETDSKDEKVMTLAKDIAMQAAAMGYQYISADEVDESYKEKELEILRAKAENEGKPAERIEGIINGQLKKQLKEVVLLDQEFVKDSKITISKLIESVSKEVGSDIKLADVARFKVGEGIEKKEEDFAAEVAKQMGN